LKGELYYGKIPKNTCLPAGREPEVIALAQAMVSGLTANAALYPAPPVLPAALTTLVSAYTTAKNAAIAAVAAAENATA
jgi:hypothetical protein